MSSLQTPSQMASSQSSFMQNYQTSSPFSGNAIGTCTDRQGNVMFFSIGNGGKLYLFQKNSGTTTGWTQIELSQGLPDNISVINFATAQASDGTPILALVGSDSQAPADAVIYYTADFNATSENRWLSYPRAQVGTVSHIAAGCDHNKNIVMVVSAEQNSQVTHYLLFAGQTTAWQDSVPFAANGQVVQIAIGHAWDYEKKYNQVLSPGEAPLWGQLYVLYRDGGNVPNMLINSFPGNVLNKTISVDPDTTTFTLVADAQQNSQLFVAGQAVYYYNTSAQWDAGGEAYRVPVASFPALSKTLTTDRNLGANLELWMLDGDGNVNLAQALDNTGSSWGTTGLPLQTQIAQLTSWKNAATDATELFWVDSNDQLFHLVQDPTTTQWQQNAIQTENVDAVTAEVTSYSLQTSVLTVDNTPPENGQATVWASEHVQVNINGKKYFVSPTTSATVPLDTLGNLNVTSVVQTLSSPTFRIQVGDQIQDINPTEELRQKFRTAFASTDWAQTQVPYYDPSQQAMVSKPLVPSGKQHNVEALTQAINQMLDLADTLPPQSYKGGTPATAGTSAYNNTLSPSQVPDNYAWGISIDAEGQSTYLDSPDIPPAGTGQKSARLDVVATLESTLGNVFHAILSGVEKLTSFIVHKVEDAIRIIVNGVWEVVLTCAEQLWTGINLLMEAVLGFDLEDMLHWLGFIFDWGDILSVHNVIRDNINSTFAVLEKMIVTAEKDVDAVFSALKQALASLDPAALGAQGDQTVSSSAAGVTNLPSNPQTNWMYTQLSSGTIQDDSHFGVTLSDGLLAQLAQLFASFANAEVTTLMSAIEQFNQEVIQNWDTLTFTEVLESTLAILGEAVLNEAEGVILLVMEVARIFLSELQSLLNKTWNVPLLSSLYSLITHGSDLTLLDTWALILAIPTTILAKAVIGEDNWNLTEEVLAAATLSSYADRVPSPSAKIGLELKTSRSSAPKVNKKAVDIVMLISGGLVGVVCRSCLLVVSGLSILKINLPLINAGLSIGSIGSGILSTALYNLTYHGKPANYVEEAMTYLQCVFPLIDIIICIPKLTTSQIGPPIKVHGKSEDILLSPAQLIEYLGKTTMGIINTGFSLALFIVELATHTEPAYAGDNALKFAQNTTMSLSQMCTMGNMAPIQMWYLSLPFYGCEIISITLLGGRTTLSFANSYAGNEVLFIRI
ncbi:MAG: hypothetical protein ACO1RX_14350 [Candidatus Sericytochromatia bacterium]